MQISINANYLRRQYGTTAPRPDTDRTATHAPCAKQGDQDIFLA